MDLSKVTYSTKPLNLREHILIQEWVEGSFAAMHAIIVQRTSMDEEEAYELDDEDLAIVLNKINESITQATVLQNLIKEL